MVLFGSLSVKDLQKFMENTQYLRKKNLFIDFSAFGTKVIKKNFFFKVIKVPLHLGIWCIKTVLE